MNTKHSILEFIDYLYLRLNRLAHHHSVSVFMFHSVSTVPRYLPSGEKIPLHSPAVFEAYVSWLAQNASITSLNKLVDLSQTKSTSRPLVALTFDDGCVDNYEVVFPILQKYACCATFYVPINVIDQPFGMTTDMLKTMIAGGMTIGSHTVTHPHLTRLNPQELEYELRLSRDVLSSSLQVDCRDFAYPYGDFNSVTVNAVAAAGYKTAVSTLEYTKEAFPLVLPRVTVPEKLSFYRAEKAIYSAKTWRRYIT